MWGGKKRKNISQSEYCTTERVPKKKKTQNKNIFGTFRVNIKQREEDYFNSSLGTLLHMSRLYKYYKIEINAAGIKIANE